MYFFTLSADTEIIFKTVACKSLKNRFETRIVESINMLQTGQYDRSSTSFNLLNDKTKSHFSHNFIFFIIVNYHLTILFIFDICINNVRSERDESCRMTFSMNFCNFLLFLNIVYFDCFATYK